MEKISHERACHVISEAPGVIRDLVSRNQELEEKVASHERHERAVKLAAEMHRKGLATDTSDEKLAERLEQADMQGKFATMEAAVDLVGPDMVAKLGSLSSDEQVQVGGSDLERFLMGDLA